MGERDSGEDDVAHRTIERSFTHDQLLELGDLYRNLRRSQLRNGTVVEHMCLFIEVELPQLHELIRVCDATGHGRRRHARQLDRGTLEPRSIGCVRPAGLPHLDAAAFDALHPATRFSPHSTSTRIHELELFGISPAFVRRICGAVALSASNHGDGRRALCHRNADAVCVDLTRAKRLGHRHAPDAALIVRALPLGGLDRPCHDRACAGPRTPYDRVALCSGVIRTEAQRAFQAISSVRKLHGDLRGVPSACR